MDQLVEETITTLHPDTRSSGYLTNGLHVLMAHYAATGTVNHWIGLVTSPAWRYNRPELIRQSAENWLDSETSEKHALCMAELQVLAVEALAGRWEPEQCRVMMVRIDGTPRMSLVCSMEGN